MATRKQKLEFIYYGLRYDRVVSFESFYKVNCNMSDEEINHKCLFIIDRRERRKGK